MKIDDVTRVLDEEGIKWHKDGNNPDYTVHLLDETCSMIDTNYSDGSSDWECRVRHRNDRPFVDVSNEDELRAWLRQRFD